MKENWRKVKAENLELIEGVLEIGADVRFGLGDMPKSVRMEKNYSNEAMIDEIEAMIEDLTTLRNRLLDLEEKA